MFYLGTLVGTIAWGIASQMALRNSCLKILFINFTYFSLGWVFSAAPSFP